MYINPFLAGVLTTLGVEIAALFFTALFAAIGRVKKDGDN